jgi:TRAP-type C4-dicarboxylate transport system substrate-binding protein
MALAVLFALLALSAPAAHAVTVKLATLAPEGSTWHKALRKMGDEWAEATNGEVELKIYAGGVVGNETVMLRKMRIGQLHAGAVTNIGLLEIDPNPQVVTTPMLIRDYDELDYVMERMKPEFEARLEANGFKVLNWGDAGWAHLFSKRPLTDPDDRGDLKIFAWEGDPAAVEMYQRAGFSPRVVAATDVVPSLQSGLLDAFPSTPLGALAMQWFGLAPNMLDVPWAPLMGATIITNEAWDAIPAEHHEILLEISRRNGEETEEEIRRQDKKAIEVMKRYGLTVNEVDDQTRAEWEQVAKSIYPVVREKVVSPEIFDQVQGLVEEYRASHP